MTNNDSNNKDGKKAPIIIKKIIVGGHGHHGGAWKVAYADFVTAMMAFFLLLWLLNAVSSEKLSGIADYFDPTVGIAGGHGIGYSGGKSDAQPDGVKTGDKQKGFRYGVPSTGSVISAPVEDARTDDEAEDQRLMLIQGDMQKSFNEDMSLSALKDNVAVAVTEEGLRITIMEQDKAPMFEVGKAELTVQAKNILFKIIKFIQFCPNYISISGHTDSAIISKDNNYTNWELSADRANSARRYMISNGVSEDQINRIIGKADTEPLQGRQSSNSINNRRIDITLLRNAIVPYQKISTPKDIVLEPELLNKQQG